MFAGHYAASFAAKAVHPRAPLWLLLLAAQFVDVLWAVFVLTGVERASLDPALASNPLHLEHMPWTHSLAGTAVWAAVAYAASRRALGLASAPAAAVAAVVASHWFLDLLVHRPDLTLAGSPPKLGLSLWNLPLTAFAVEVALLVASVAWAMRSCATGSESRWRWQLMGAGLVAMQTATSFGPLPPSIPAMTTSVLVIFAAVSFAGSKVDAAA